MFFLFGLPSCYFFRSFCSSCSLKEIRHNFYQCLTKLDFNFLLVKEFWKARYNSHFSKTDLFATVYFIFVKYQASFYPLEKGHEYIISHTSQPHNWCWKHSDQWRCETFGKCSKTSIVEVWNFVQSYIKFHPMDGCLKISAIWVNLW